MNIFGVLIWFYLLGYIGMGLVQPIAAICRILTSDRSDNTYTIGLKRYLGSVAVYFILMFIMTALERHVDIGNILIFYTLILPWGFSIWYILHISNWRKKRNNIKAYDMQKLLKAPHADRLLLETYPKKKVNLKHPVSNRLLGSLKSKKTVIKTLPNLTVAN